MPFAEILGVSKRTLQEWEQGRKKPRGAASSLLKIAIERPDVLQEVLNRRVNGRFVRWMICRVTLR